MTVTMVFTPQTVSVIFVVLVIFTIIANVLYVKRSGFRKSYIEDYRQITAYGLLDRAKTWAVEAGQRIHCSLGNSGLYGIAGVSTLVGGQLLHLITRTLVHVDHPTIATSGDGMVGILAQDEQHKAYSSAGIPGEYASDMGEVTGLTPWSYAAGAYTLMIDQQADVNVLIGHFGSEVGLLSEACELSSTELIGGSDSLNAQAVLFATAQAPIVGEELYVAGAYYQPDPWQWASLKTQDLLRWFLIGLIITGLALKLIGVK